jgi:hypothetical protein
MYDKSQQQPPRCLDAALAYAKFGWYVFPADLRDPKHKKSYKAARYSSKGKRWGATRDPEQIKRDFRRWPTAAIGLPCGVENDVFVLEADTKEGHDVDGIANLQTLIDANSPLPETRMARSPTGSIHYYFTHPNRGLVRNSTSALAPGVDVRGEGGMVVVAPSVRPGVGKYTWLNRADIKRAPPWLVALVTEKPTKYQPGDPFAPFDKVAEALDLLSNDESSQWQIVDADGVVLKELTGWKGWNILAMAIYRATSGSDEGYELLDRWTCKHPSYNNEQSKQFVQHTWYKRFPRCPPIETTVATLFAVVDDEHPGWQAIWNEEHNTDDDDEIDASFAAARQKYEARHD